MSRICRASGTSDLPVVDAGAGGRLSARGALGGWGTDEHAPLELRVREAERLAEAKPVHEALGPLLDRSLRKRLVEAVPALGGGGRRKRQDKRRRGQRLREVLRASAM